MDLGGSGSRLEIHNTVEYNHPAIGRQVSSTGMTALSVRYNAGRSQDLAWKTSSN
jgi:hypothetical protein